MIEIVDSIGPVAGAVIWFLFCCCLGAVTGVVVGHINSNRNYDRRERERRERYRTGRL